MYIIMKPIFVHISKILNYLYKKHISYLICSKNKNDYVDIETHDNDDTVNVLFYTFSHLKRPFY